MSKRSLLLPNCRRSVEIRGLPLKSPQLLTDTIMDVARAKSPPRPVIVQSLITPPPDPIAAMPIPIQAGGGDLIMGDDAHYEVFAKTIADAKRRVFMHSTFLRQDAFNTHIALFKDAVRRGVRFEIFWGSGSPEEPSTRTLTEAAALSKQLSTDSLLKDRIHIHLRSTGSHCKLLIADDGFGDHIHQRRPEVIAIESPEALQERAPQNETREIAAQRQGPKCRTTTSNPRHRDLGRPAE